MYQVRQILENQKLISQFYFIQKLGEINAMIKGGTRRRVLLDADEETGPTAPKRPLNGLAKRAQALRQEQMNHRPLNNHK